MKLEPNLSVVPILHGRTLFAAEVRRLCLTNHYDCIAVDLPAPFSSALAAAVDELPYVSAVMTAGPVEPVYYVPTDPCDAAIEGIRQARQNLAACEFVGYPWLAPPAPLPPLPDEHAILSLGFDGYTGLCVHALGKEPLSDQTEREAQYCACRLHALRAQYRSILALVHLRHFTRTLWHYGREETHNRSFPPAPPCSFRTLFVNPDHLYFALGELPFAAGRLERSRQDPLAPDYDAVRMVKDLFMETRDEYAESRDEIVELSPARIQIALTFLRNLTVQSGMLMPTLFDIVAAAKGVGGNSYALRILKNAKYYPYLAVEYDSEYVAVGIDQVRLPGEENPRKAVNLLKDTALVWMRLPLKPEPSLRKKKLYRYRWNPTGMCSHVPEDRRIESFNVHVRSKALRVLSEDMVRTEKFLTSMRDGLDIRETLRNWYTGDIYVKELPPSQGDLDTVVIIFDAGHDERYPHRATWYAEHDQESTLTFYATDPMQDLIGPGIARASYGGLSLLFPPRPVPNIFAVTEQEDFRSVAHQLVYGALLFSKERNVAYLASSRPDLTMRATASRLKKHLVWIPLSSFSTETLRRLRRFHVLNGKTVRSWAARFIGE